MKVVLEIKNEVDLTVMLPLLERLKIPFILPKNAKANVASPDTDVSKQSTAKNFDIDKLEALFKELQQMKAFAHVEDPTVWQRETRSEWY